LLAVCFCCCHPSRKCLQSVKDMPIVQDMPPVGGFPSIRIQRRLPSTGPTGVAIFAVGAAVMAYGYYNVRKQKHVSYT
jgi:NADH dehydrogenase (ubiquinone) 1 alpha subcomplex subunit 13